MTSSTFQNKGISQWGSLSSEINPISILWRPKWLPQNWLFYTENWFLIKTNYLSIQWKIFLVMVLKGFINFPWYNFTPHPLPLGFYLCVSISGMINFLSIFFLFQITGSHGKYQVNASNDTNILAVRCAN